jgi:hypothetical protein
MRASSAAASAGHENAGCLFLFDEVRFFFRFAVFAMVWLLSPEKNSIQ